MQLQRHFFYGRVVLAAIFCALNFVNAQTLTPSDSSSIVNLTASEGDDLEPMWSPDGRKIIFYSTRKDNSNAKYKIYSMNSDGTNQQKLPDSKQDFRPVWSPDGTKIAFDSFRDGNHEIYVANTDGTGLTRLTNDPAYDSSPRWSPDGAKLVYFSGVEATGREAKYPYGNSDVYVMHADGSNKVRLTTTEGDDTYPFWSPDGRKIAFTSFRDGNAEIYVMNADGSHQVRLTNDPARDDNARWSPDGKKIGFGSFRDGNYEVYMMNADGTSQKNLTQHAANDVDPSWSPDGKKIAFASNRSRSYDIYVMNLKLDQETASFRLPNVELSGRVKNVQISGDGFVQVNGGKLYFEIAGEGCPLILIGGSGSMDLRQWDEQFKFFQQDFKAIRYDPRGVGKSDLPTASFSHVEDLEALLNFLGVDKAVLTGLSSGGGIAFDFALTHPQRVLALVLSAPVVNGYKFSAEQQQRVASFASAAQRGAETYIKTLLEDSFLIPAPQNPEARKRAQVLIAENFRPFDFSLIKQLEPPTVARVAEIDKPALLLVGNLDHPDVQKRTVFLEQSIRGAKRVTIKNAGHLVNLEAPHDFNQAVYKFLVAWNFHNKGSLEK